MLPDTAHLAVFKQVMLGTPSVTLIALLGSDVRAFASTSWAMRSHHMRAHRQLLPHTSCTVKHTPSLVSPPGLPSRTPRGQMIIHQPLFWGRA